MHAWQLQLNGDDDDDDDEDDDKMPCKTLIVLWHILNAGFWFETCNDMPRHIVEKFTGQEPAVSLQQIFEPSRR